MVNRIFSGPHHAPGNFNVPKYSPPAAMGGQGAVALATSVLVRHRVDVLNRFESSLRLEVKLS